MAAGATMLPHLPLPLALALGFPIVFSGPTAITLRRTLVSGVRDSGFARSAPISNPFKRHRTLAKLRPRIYLGSDNLVEMHNFEIEGKELRIARPEGIDDTILEVAEAGGDLDKFFWAFVWPSSTALAQEFRTNPLLVKGKTVVEIGSGLGVPGIMAAAEGAKKVLLLDDNEKALHCAFQTAQENGLSISQEGEEGLISGRQFDWDSPNWPTEENEKFDVVILGDVFQGTNIVKKLTQKVPTMVKPEGCVIIAGGSLDVAELNFVGSMTSKGYGLEEVSKKRVYREFDVQMEDPNGNQVHLVRLREGAGSVETPKTIERAIKKEDEDDLDEVDVDELLERDDRDKGRGPKDIAI
ncbi:hypothetical protein AAMO2058_001520300 [Amorphochlora amoebiformis]